MADSKVTDLAAASTLVGTETLYVVQGGTSKKASIQQLGQYPGMGGLYNLSVANQGAGFAADTYLTGSDIALPVPLLQAKTFYRCVFNVSKTGAGLATPIITVRIGTAGTTADASRAALTFAAQTGVVDEGMFEIWAVFKTVGSGTSATIGATGKLSHRLSITGLSTDVTGVKNNTGAGFDSTTANTKIGLSVNGGTSAAWTVNSVVAELRNTL